MKVRIKFTKQGPMKFIGHLDIMRYFQKAMRRANVDIRYSEGFSPHQIMSFAAPLGVGLTSNGEYLDIEVMSTEDSKSMVSRLNEAMADGIRVVSYRRLPDTAKNAMSLVDAADYTAVWREGYAPEDMETFSQKLNEFLHSPKIRIVKATKKGERELDIKPLIYDFRIDGGAIFLRLSAGSTDNLKPDLVLKAFYESRGEEYPGAAFQFQREEVYAPGLISLDDLGEDIE